MRPRSSLQLLPLLVLVLTATLAQARPTPGVDPLASAGSLYLPLVAHTTPPAITTEQVIGPQGGAALDVSGAVVSVLPGALAQPTALRIGRYAAAPAGAPLAGNAFFFGPEGTTFAKPAVVSVPYDPARIPAGVAESDLQLLVYRGGAWSVVPGSVVDTARKVVSGQTSGFSGFAAGANGPGLLQIAPFNWRRIDSHPWGLVFDATGRTRPGAEIAGGTWSFGDGKTETFSCQPDTACAGLRTRNDYAANGSYPITLDLRYRDGTSERLSHTISVPDTFHVACRPDSPLRGPAPHRLSWEIVTNWDDAWGNNLYNWDAYARNLVLDLGDGQRFTKDVFETSWAHVYQNPGTYTMTTSFDIVNPVTGQVGIHATCGLTVVVEPITSCPTDIGTAATWTGTFTFSYAKSATEGNTTIEQKHSGSVQVGFAQAYSNADYAGWNDTSMTGSGSINNRHVEVYPEETRISTVVGSGPTLPSGITQDQPGASLSFDRRRCTLQFHLQAGMNAVMTTPDDSYAVQEFIGLMDVESIPIETAARTISGSRRVPVHFLAEGRDLTDFFAPGADWSGDLEDMVGIGNMGNALVTWKLTRQ